MGKLIPHKKILDDRGTNQKVPKKHELERSNSCKEIHHSRGTKQNMPKAHELKKLDPCKEIHHSGGTKQICMRHVCYGNLTFIKRSVTMEA